MQFECILRHHIQKIPIQAHFPVIQRVQTLLLLSAAIIDIFIFFTPLYSRAVADPQRWIGIGFALMLTGALIIALISIFLYKKRQIQLRWVKTGSLIQICALAIGTAILFTLGGFGTFLLKEATSLLFLLLGVIAYWQAGRFINKDEELVKSMDRIR